jgi:hypothetical protein
MKVARIKKRTVQKARRTGLGIDFAEWVTPLLMRSLSGGFENQPTYTISSVVRDAWRHAALIGRILPD